MVVARRSADVLHVRKAVRRLGAGMRDVDAEVVDEPVSHDVDRNWHRHAGSRRAAAEIRKHIQRVGLVVAVLELRLKYHLGAAAAAAAAQTPPAPPPAPPPPPPTPP